jgi:hypothetical protein
MNCTFKKYIVSGRVPGADDDTLAEITVYPEQSPIVEFIEKVLYVGDIPPDWQTRPPTESENKYREWAYIQDLIELE